MPEPREFTNPVPRVIIDGLVKNRLELDFGDFEAGPPEAHVYDVSRYHPSRSGDAVALAWILEKAGLLPEANYITLHAERDDFHVSVPLEPLLDEGLLVYKIKDAPLTISQGGPIRFLVKNPLACHTGELDECANVKYLSRIELCERKGQDTRPSNESEHQALHSK